ncbi:MAG: ATP-binding protein [Paludibacteraceae bacterium]|nr:ATP-binding protein [Paludibacteraceae bacterium]
MENPFYITGIIPTPYFCDREKESLWMVRTLQNNAHVLLTSSRRMGKTQLIRHVFEKPAIKDNYYTFYTDIYATTTLHEFVLFLSKEIYSVLVPKGKSVLGKFLAGLHSLAGSFGYDPLSGTPTFNVKLGDIHTPELTLEEIFGYLEQADKPCIFAIDEFQQIANYPEKNVEALLRTHIQKMNNCLFIYAGSNQHILENMFNSEAKPFYNSAEQIYLDSIPKDIYTGFAMEQFAKAGRSLTPEAASLAYDLFEGHTYYVHNVLHNAFAYEDPDKPVNNEAITRTLDGILEEKGRSFVSVMNQLNYQQKETLIAIAKEGKASGVTSVAFVKKHALKSPSSVQYAIGALLEKQILTYQTEDRAKVYSVSDKFMGMWMNRTY